MTARTPPTLSESDRPDVLQSLRDGWSLDDAARGFRRKGADVLADADANGWRGDLDAAIAEGRRQAAPRDMAAEWKKAILVNQATQSPPEAPAPDDEPTIADPWARARREAAALAPGRLGTLLWVDARCQSMQPPMFALDPWWVDAFASFYASGKMVMVCRKGLRAGGSASACRALVRAALFTERDLDPGTVGVIPIMSATRDEANDRFVTIRAILRACGIGPTKDSDDEGNVPAPGGIGAKYKSTKSQAGGGMIQVQDSQGHRLEFRILPVLLRHAVGYTAVDGFLDESDLWPDDPEKHQNPAQDVFDTIGERFTTQPQAELFIFSASYKAESAHSRAVDEGDTPLQHVARLGEYGARVDEDERRRLALTVSDPKLIEPADPRTPDIPAWVSNRTKSPIDTCWLWSKGRVTRLLGRYGGRAKENVTEEGGLDTLRDVELPHGLRGEPIDTVIGVAPSADGSQWGIVRVGYATSGTVHVLADISGDLAGGAAVLRLLSPFGTVSVLAVARAHAPRLASEIAAARAEQYAPPVAEQDVYDGAVLRVGPLRSLYLAGRLRHAPGLDALEAEARAWTPGGKRSPRLEALACAVKRLVDCYPVGGAAFVPGKTPGPRGAMNERGSEED